MSWQLLELPLPLDFSRPAVRHHGFDRINARSKAMISHMRGRYRVTGCSRGSDCCFVFRVAGCSVGGDRRLLGGTDSDLASCPCSRFLNRLVWTTIAAVLSKQRQHPFGAISRPRGEQPVRGRFERSAPMHRHKASVSHAWIMIAQRIVQIQLSFMTTPAMIVSPAFAKFFSSRTTTKPDFSRTRIDALLCFATRAQSGRAVS
jgi:hypothetical protein